MTQENGRTNFLEMQFDMINKAFANYQEQLNNLARGLQLMKVLASAVQDLNSELERIIVANNLKR